MYSFFRLYSHTHWRQKQIHKYFYFVKLQLNKISPRTTFPTIKYLGQTKYFNFFIKYDILIKRIILFIERVYAASKVKRI